MSPNMLTGKCLQVLVISVLIVTFQSCSCLCHRLIAQHFSLFALGSKYFVSIQIYVLAVALLTQLFHTSAPHLVQTFCALYDRNKDAIFLPVCKLL